MTNLYEKAKKVYKEHDKLYQEFMAECNSVDRNDVKVAKLQDEMQKLADELDVLELQM